MMSKYSLLLLTLFQLILVEGVIKLVLNKVNKANNYYRFNSVKSKVRISEG